MHFDSHNGFDSTLTSYKTIKRHRIICYKRNEKYSTNMSCITNSEDEMVVFKGNVAFYASAIILRQCYKKISMACNSTFLPLPAQLHNDPYDV